MKKIFVIICFLAICLSCYADNNSIICPSESLQIIEKESTLNKYSGLNFLSKKITEIAIEKALKKELNSKFNAELNIYTIKRLKKGEFKSLTLKSDLFSYKAMSLSNFVAESVCSYNRIIYSNKKIYFPYDLPFKFQAEISNADIKNIINSYEFQKEIERNTLKINNFTGYRLLEPKVEIRANKLYFIIPIKTFLSKEPLYFNINSDIEVNKNKIVLRDTTFSTKSNIINIDLLGSIVNRINPISFQNSTINNKYCKLYITNAKIDGDKIKIEGSFLLNQNYGRSNE